MQSALVLALCLHVGGNVHRSWDTGNITELEIKFLCVLENVQVMHSAFCNHLSLGIQSTKQWEHYCNISFSGASSTCWAITWSDLVPNANNIREVMRQDISKWSQYYSVLGSPVSQTIMVIIPSQHTFNARCDACYLIKKYHTDVGNDAQHLPQLMLFHTAQYPALVSRWSAMLLTCPDLNTDNEGGEKSFPALQAVDPGAEDLFSCFNVAEQQMFRASSGQRNNTRAYI